MSDLLNINYEGLFLIILLKQKKIFLGKVTMNKENANIHPYTINMFS